MMGADLIESSRWTIARSRRVRARSEELREGTNWLLATYFSGSLLSFSGASDAPDPNRSPLLSATAARLLDALKNIPGRKLCVVCAGERRTEDRDTVLKSIRELVGNGHVVCGPFECSACHGLELVAFHRPFGFRPLDG